MCQQFNVKLNYIQKMILPSGKNETAQISSIFSEKWRLYKKRPFTAFATK